MGLHMLLIFSLICSTPVINGNDNDNKQQDSDKEVKQLENLRMENYKPNDAPSVSSVIQQDETATASDDNIEPQPNSISAIFRHRGKIQEKKNKYWNEKIQEVGIQYSPADLATYVFNTGDEEGVAVAVEELVREGMMGRTDAINYLQDVKQILNDMREKIPKQEEKSTTHPASDPKEEEATYAFTLDVIYKLSKDMFTQSILRDDLTAEETLSGLVTFLESEVGNKRISPAMKEKVLEIVSAALVDSLREYQRSQNQPFDEHHKLGIKGPANMFSTNNNKPKSS